MEAAEQFSEEWNSLSGVYTAEEADFMNQLLGEQFYENFNFGTESSFWPCHESTIVRVTENNNNSYFPAQIPDTDFVCFLQGNSSSDDCSNIFPTTSGGNYTSNNPVTDFGYMSMGFSLMDSKFSPCSVQGNDSKQINENTDKDLEVLADKSFQVQKECEILVSEPEEDKTRSQEKSGKRARSSIEVHKNKRNVKSKKNPRSASISNNEEGRSPVPQSCCSDDDSNASHGGASSSLSPKDSKALKLSGKSSSSRGGPATDPQSVYARRRRERINERLKILQNLVPNGTKVDISTMLEEAVQYVKFLQLQIKLLSSDDLWMYAPIAYNGMNIGLELNITPKEMLAIKEDTAI